MLEIGALPIPKNGHLSGSVSKDFNYLFKRTTGILNKGKWLRIGVIPYKGGTFSIRGKLIDWVTGKKESHWDLFKIPE
jgi:hypothetical protein